jgi:hypothetical protein
VAPPALLALALLLLPGGHWVLAPPSPSSSESQWTSSAAPATSAASCIVGDEKTLHVAGTHPRFVSPAMSVLLPAGTGGPLVSVIDTRDYGATAPPPIGARASR